MRKVAPRELIWLPTGGHIGDAIMVVSLFAEMVQKEPDLRIYYLVRRNVTFIRELTYAYPNITVIPISYTPFAAFSSILPLFRKRSIVIAPPPWGRRPRILKLLCFLFRIRGDVVVAFDDGAAWKPYTAVVTHDRSIRYIDNLRRAAHVALLPMASEGTPPHITFTTSFPEDFPFAGRPYIVVHMFPNMAMRKSLPLRRWKELIGKIRAAHPDHSIVITGATVDRVSAESVASEGVFLAIDRPIRQVAGMIAGARLYLGVDTGPTHIAGVLHAPSVILAQQGEPMWMTTYNPNATQLWDKEHCVCGRPGETCEVVEEGTPYRRCLYYLSDETILAAIDHRLSMPVV